MELSEIEQVVHKIIIEQSNDMVTIENDELLMNHGFDSLKTIELVVFLEGKFNFEFEMNMLTYETLKSISSISKYIYQRIKEKE